jgi:hypothetical protein
VPLGRQQSKDAGDAEQYDEQAAAQRLRLSTPLAPLKAVLLLLPPDVHALRVSTDDISCRRRITPV